MKTIIKGADLSTAIEEVLLRVGESSFPWNRSHISGEQVRGLINAPEDAELLVLFKEREEHIQLDHDHWIDLISEEVVVELFYIRQPGEVLVDIEVNEKRYIVKPGTYTVAAIKTIGHVPLNFDLEQVIDGKLNLLDDNGSVEIKGCEVFKGHVKDGSSS